MSIQEMAQDLGADFLDEKSHRNRYGEPQLHPFETDLPFWSNYDAQEAIMDDVRQCFRDR